MDREREQQKWSADDLPAPRAHAGAARGILKRLWNSLLSDIVGLRNRSASARQTRRATMDVPFARTLQTRCRRLVRFQCNQRRRQECRRSQCAADTFTTQMFGCASFVRENMRMMNP